MTQAAERYITAGSPRRNLSAATLLRVRLLRVLRLLLDQLAQEAVTLAQPLELPLLIRARRRLRVQQSPRLRITWPGPGRNRSSVRLQGLETPSLDAHRYHRGPLRAG
mgnify:CR=1 FL=1